MTYYRERELTEATRRACARNHTDGVPGLYTGEAPFLIKMARLAPDGDSLEIGIRHGHSIILWGLERLGRGRLLGIELVDRPLMRENITRSGLPIEIVIGDSARMELAVSELAFCFVDGDHRAVGIR